MRFYLLPLASAITLALNPLSVLAAEPSSAADANDQNIEKITVMGKYTVSRTIDTATGLGLSLQETPQSVSILTAERIQDQVLNTVVDVVNNTVGLSSSKTDNVRNGFMARGFAVQNYQIDGVPLSWSLGGDAGETVSDISLYERVEVVRGATGLLTGAGDPSASINLVRKHADSDELKGYVDVATGSWDKKQVTADVSNGLNDSGSVRGRMVAKYVNSDSYQDLYQDRKTILYGVIDSDITDNTMLRVGGSYNNNNPKGAMWGALPAVFSDGSVTDWDVSTTTAADWSRWETTNINYFANLNHYFSNGWQLVANYNRMEYETTTKMIYMSGLLNKETGAGLSGQRYHSHGESNSDNFDFQLKGDYQLFNREHQFVTGALYSKQKSYADTYEPIRENMTGWDSKAVENFYDWQSNAFEEPEWSTNANRQLNMDTEQKGFYAATRLTITDDLKVIAGGRISSWNREGISYGTDTNFGDDGVFVPYVGALYDINEEHRVYASYTEIFNPQNSKDINGDYLDPLEGKAYEIGLKSAYLDDRLHTAVALFKIEQDNLATAAGTIIVDGTPTTYYKAAQGTESTGFELEVVGEFIDGWNITAGYSQFTAEDADGKKVAATSPRKQFKLFTTYQFVDYLPELTVGGGINWQSDSYSEGGTVKIDQDAYSLVNLMARYNLTDNMDLQLNVENLLDEKYYAYMSASASMSEAYSVYHYGTPRNVTLSFNYRF
ncbi:MULTISPECIES: TonB-dependent siderophore receptor [unclassified Shewanella]|uniref:TonB-dependent siderophore receptor n=2 Tax=Shewanella TaxID=22 RepID=UPI0021D8C51A|nr:MULTISPECIES: TonB-dependent siderophore receptor [unclassified Shewanella]MCU8003012.1 TonB-dependent siderophore receptor [Shewanella sp. SM96]MCU8060812.1 TonB-dependent siderophore receptor [Shewanella sp. SM55]